MKLFLLWCAAAAVLLNLGFVVVSQGSAQGQSICRVCESLQGLAR